MRIKYSPVYDLFTTIIVKETEFSLTIDGQLMEFDLNDGDYPSVYEESNGKIVSAEVVDGVLSVEVPFHYEKPLKNIWEDPNYYQGGGYKGTQWEEL